MIGSATLAYAFSSVCRGIDHLRRVSGRVRSNESPCQSEVRMGSVNLDYFLHAANILLLASYSVRDIHWLRFSQSRPRWRRFPTSSCSRHLSAQRSAGVSCSPDQHLPGVASADGTPAGEADARGRRGSPAGLPGHVGQGRPAATFTGSLREAFCGGKSLNRLRE